MSGNDSLKPGRMDESLLDLIPKDKGAIRILSFSRKMSDPGLLPEQQGFIDSKQLQRDKVVKGGINGDSFPEMVPEHNAADYEKILENKNNARIIIGRDRPGNKASGYGNMGASGAGAIYLIAGRAFPPSKRGSEQIYADNNFKTDAAGIYISQLTDIDNNYELAQGSLVQKARSGIGIKADGVRIIARENIKLVTGPFIREQNSLGGKSISYKGIDIIAGNNDSNLQPMVLGDNLSDCLTELVSLVTNLSSLMDQFILAQDSFEKSLSNHIHPGSTSADGTPVLVQVDPTITSALSRKAVRMTEKVNTKLMDWRKEVSNFKVKYLNERGEKTIRSSHNNVN
jgi:hypothetical protein